METPRPGLLKAKTSRLLDKYYWAKRTDPQWRGQQLLEQARRRAKQKRLDFSLTWDWLRPKLEAGCCEVTGVPFEYFLIGLSRGKPHAFAPSIDRIDSRKGYTTGNCRLVVWIVNQMRGAFDDELVLYVAQQWIARLPTEGMTHGRRDDD